MEKKAKNPKAKKQLLRMIPLQRIGKPKDIANIGHKTQNDKEKK